MPDIQGTFFNVSDVTTTVCDAFAVRRQAYTTVTIEIYNLYIYYRILNLVDRYLHGQTALPQWLGRPVEDRRESWLGWLVTIRPATLRTNRTTLKGSSVLINV